jgi:cytochrome c biogenesis protein CcmG/thiol:disulfide interchange protein DsbE
VSNRPSQSKSASQRVRAASNAGKSRSTTWLWVGLIAVIAVVGVVAIVIGRGSGSSGGGTASPSGGTVVPNGKLDFGTVQVQGTNIPAKPDTGADPAIGMTIPTVAGQQFDGKQLTISPDGTPRVIMVVAHWCPHCQAEVPRIQSWLNASGMPTGVELATVATANDSAKPNFPAADWLRTQKWSVPTIVDDKQSTAGAAFGVSAFPYFLVTDGQGKVVYRTSGEVSQDQWNAILEAARTGVAPAA